MLEEKTPAGGPHPDRPASDLRILKDGRRTPALEAGWDKEHLPPNHPPQRDDDENGSRVGGGVENIHQVHSKPHASGLAP